MSDLISRQAAIEVIDAVMPVDPNKSEYASGIACGAALAMTYVKQLPSAQPEERTEERTETHACDCISRQAALDCFHDWIDKHGDVHAADEMPEYQAIEALPSAQPDRSLWFHIGELCVDESKGNITAEVAIKKIRALLKAERREE